MFSLFPFVAVTIITEAADTLTSQSETAVTSVSQSQLETQEESESDFGQYDVGEVEADLEE